MAFCMRNMKTATIIDQETGKRCDKTEYPVSAIREAVLNALIHRDYSIYTEARPFKLTFSATVWKFTVLVLCTVACRSKTLVLRTPMPAIRFSQL